MVLVDFEHVLLVQQKVRAEASDPRIGLAPSYARPCAHDTIVLIVYVVGDRDAKGLVTEDRVPEMVIAFHNYPLIPILIVPRRRQVVGVMQPTRGNQPVILHTTALIVHPGIGLVVSEPHLRLNPVHVQADGVFPPGLVGRTFLRKALLIPAQRTPPRRSFSPK